MTLVLASGGTVAFALSGGLAAIRARLDAFGVVTVAVLTAVAGGIVRDLLIGVPPAAFRSSGPLVTAVLAGLLCCVAPSQVGRSPRLLLVADALGLGLFCVTGAAVALDHGIEPIPAAVLGMVTGVGGGVMRDVVLGEVPAVLRVDLYATPALVGAAVVVVGDLTAIGGPNTHAIVGAALCTTLRLAGHRFRLTIPRPG